MGNSREKQLIKNTGILALGKICTQFVSFFLLPLYTAYLSTKEYGVVDLLNNYITLLIPIFFFQMDQAVFRFLIDARKKEKEKTEIISTAISTVTIQTIMFVAVYLIFAIFLKNDYKIFLLTNVVVAMYASLFLQICRGLGDNMCYSLGSLMAGICTVVLNVIFIAVFKIGAYGMLTATLISNIICIVFIFIKKKIYLLFSIKHCHKKIRKELWKYSVPLIPNQLSWWIVNVSDRTIVAYVLGVGVNGIYSAANKFSGICITFFNIFNMTWSESASMHIKDNDSSVFFTNILNTTLKFFVALCLIIIAFMPFVFKLLITGKGFANAYYQIPILLIATIFNILVSLLGSVYVALKETKKIAKTSIAAAIINITTNLLMIKFIGLYAASISTVLAYLSMSIYRFIDVQKYVKIKLDKKFIAVAVVVASVIIAIYYTINTYLCILSALISLVFAFIFNIDTLRNGVHIVKYKIKKQEKNRA